MDARDLALVIVAIVEIIIGLALYVTNSKNSDRMDRHQAEIESHNEQMRRIQSDSSSALIRMAEVFERRLGSPSAPASADLRVRWHGARNRESVVVTNRGSAPADVVDVETIGDPSLLVEPKLPSKGVTLRPGDSFEIRAAPSLATPLHIDVRVTWAEASGTYQSDFTISTA